MNFRVPNYQCPMTIVEVKKEIHRLDPTLKEEDESFKAAVVLLSSAFVGPSIDKVAKFAGYRDSDIAEMCRRLRANKVWSGGKLQVEWLDKENGGIAFWLDVGVARGLLQRTAE